MDTNARYWLVGAYWDRQYDMSDVFTHLGYWEMGWDDPDKPDFAELRDGMRRGDRIAIKALGGRGKSYLLIKALGVVEAVDPKERRVYVDWKVSGLSRKVELHGEFSTIREPLSPDEDEERIREIFTI